MYPYPMDPSLAMMYPQQPPQ